MHVLHVAWAKHWHAHGLQRLVALGGEARALRSRVVAHDQYNTAKGRGPRRIGMANRIARPVEPRRLAVPKTICPIDGRAGTQTNMLTAPDSRRSQILIQPRLEAYIQCAELVFLRPELLV